MAYISLTQIYVTHTRWISTFRLATLLQLKYKNIAQNLYYEVIRSHRLTNSWFNYLINAIPICINKPGYQYLFETKPLPHTIMAYCRLDPFLWVSSDWLTLESQCVSQSVSLIRIWIKSRVTCVLISWGCSSMSPAYRQKTDPAQISYLRVYFLLKLPSATHELKRYGN